MNCIKVVFYDKDQLHDSQNLDLIVKEVSWSNAGIAGLRSVNLPILAIKVPVPGSPSPGTLTFTGFTVYGIGFCPATAFESRDCIVVYECGSTPNIVNRHFIYDDAQQILGESLDARLTNAYMAAGDVTLASLDFNDPEYSSAQNRANALDVGDCA